MTIEIRNPARPSEIVSRYEETPITEIDQIVTRAREAQKQWAKVPMPERARIVAKIIDAIENDRDRIARIVTLEQGKPLSEAKGEIGKSALEARAVLSRGYAPIGDVLPSAQDGMFNYSMRRPRGVVLGICPWNFPVNTPLRKTVPGLLYGNAIILKPSEITPGASFEIEKITNEFLPKHLFQVVLGGPEFGAALTSALGIDAISFTGSVQTGKKIASAAAQNLAEISLELGGKNPVIVDNVDDMQAMAAQIYKSAMINAGQRCTSISRVLVRAEEQTKLVDHLVKFASDEKLADGTEEGTTMGPLVSADHFKNVSGFVDRAIKEGAHLATGGVPKSNDPETGYFYPPTILTNVTRKMEIATEEVFGPVLVVMKYQTIDEAIDIANDIEYGLTSSLFSTHTAVVERFIAESQSGMIHVNIGTFPDEHVPFVGAKASSLGVGGSNGASLEQFYTSEHAVYIKRT